jgi:hypothetical protein
MEPSNHDDDETLPNFIKETHPRKGDKNKQIAMTKVERAKEPQRCKPHKGKGTINIKTCTNHMKHIN